MSRRICVLVVLALICFVAGYNRSMAAQGPTSADDASLYSAVAPPFLSPGKNVFATQEGDPFVVTVTATCLLEDDGGAQFELLDPAPAFVQVSDVYRKENKANGYAESLGVVFVAPQIGDAGKYVVRLRVRACSGKVERVITFKVKVKPSQRD